MHPESSHITPAKLMHLGLGFMASKTLLSAVELGVFTELAKGPLDAATVGQRLGIHPRAQLDFLDTLVTLKLLNRQNGLYTNAPESDLFLDAAKPSYLGGFFEMLNARLFHHWDHFTEALRTGQQQNESRDGVDIFKELYADPARLRQFLGAMAGLSIPGAQAMAQKFPWKNYKTFADVGCALGAAPVQIAVANPHLQAVGFDLPPVGPIFEEYVAAQGLKDRVKFQAGSFFTDPLPNVDVIVMGHVLHDWDLPTKKMLIKKAYDALPAGGAFIAYETLIDDGRCENLSSFLISLNMLIETPGGFDYTGADGQAWMKEIGFRETRVEHLAGPDSMVVGIK
jgi:O-methyltransferase domain/Dimerisation domain